MVYIRTDSLSERDRLLQALANARVTRCRLSYIVSPEHDEELNVRAGTSTKATVVGTVEAGREVAIAESRGHWSRITAPVAGFVWHAHLSRTSACGDTD